MTKAPVRALALSILGFLLIATLAAVAAPPNAPSAPGFGPTDREPGRCLTCHDDAKTLPILQTPHAMKGDKRTPFAHDACGSCHGDGQAHLANRTAPMGVRFSGPSASPVAQRNDMCLTCHASGLRMNWHGSQHQTNDVACADCHKMHEPKDAMLIKAAQPQRCFTCHAEQRADSFKFSHHPIREGKVVCSDCHNPHGSPGPKLINEFRVNELCYNCHAEKRGPLLWEHLPVRENCMNCHTPHGSAQPRLLIQRVPWLCQECHDSAMHPSEPLSGQNLAGTPPNSVRTFSAPGIMGGTTTRYSLILRGCTNCHSQVHGSNSPSGGARLR